MEREVRSNTVRLRDERCTFILERLKQGVILIAVTGFDKGTFGSSLVKELQAELEAHRPAPVRVYVDASKAEGATWQVSTQWAAWFQANRDHLAEVHILVLSRVLHHTVSLGKQLSRVGHRIKIYADADAFSSALRETVPDWSGLIGAELV